MLPSYLGMPKLRSLRSKDDAVYEKIGVLDILD